MTRKPREQRKNSPGAMSLSAAEKKLQRERADMMAFTGCGEDEVDALLAIERGEPNAGCCKAV